MLTMVCRVLGVQRVQGVNGKTKESYDFKVLHVLDGFKSRELRIPADYDGDLPSAKRCAECGAPDWSPVSILVRPVIRYPEQGRPFQAYDFVGFAEVQDLDPARAA